jgi:hypothetical protein
MYVFDVAVEKAQLRVFWAKNTLNQYQIVDF